MEIRKLASKWVIMATKKKPSPWLTLCFVLVASVNAISYINRGDDFHFYMTFAWLFLAILHFETMGFWEIIKEKDERIAELEGQDPQHAEKINETRVGKEI